MLILKLWVSGRQEYTGISSSDRVYCDTAKDVFSNQLSKFQRLLAIDRVIGLRTT